MSDLDARIRERMSNREPIAEWPGFAWDVVQAIRAVLDLHRHAHPEAGHGRCSHCGDPYPCPTVIRVAAALGVTE